VVSFTARPLYLHGKNPWYPLDRRLGGPQSRSGCGGEENNSKPLGGWVGPRAGLDAVVKRKIPSLYRDSNSLIIQTIAQPYITEL
jgi:hypothetical protein